jgi:hypothetical protein
MEIFILAFIGGIVGAVLMDVTETYAAKLGITSGVNIALVGRWFLSLSRGKYIHSNIINTRAYRHEVQTGWAFHILIGGGGVALVYPLFFMVAGMPLPENFLLSGILFGLSTSALPWFILLPAFGWGVCGRRGPQGTNALLASTLSHVPYGLGVTAVIALSHPT